MCLYVNCINLCLKLQINLKWITTAVIPIRQREYHTLECIGHHECDDVTELRAMVLACCLL
jgi:hypothetical protein